MLRGQDTYFQVNNAYGSYLGWLTTNRVASQLAGSAQPPVTRRPGPASGACFGLARFPLVEALPSGDSAGVCAPLFAAFPGVGSEEARPAGAGLRPPLKRYVRFSRIPLSRRRLRVMRTDGGIKEWNPPPARRVQPVGKSPRSLMLGYFTHGTVHLSALAHLTVLSGPDRLRRPPSPTHSVAAP